jgi:hypothetical protein
MPRLIPIGLALGLVGCSSAPATCPGTAPTTLLEEGYCTSGEADRCFFDPKPMDGF